MTDQVVPDAMVPVSLRPARAADIPALVDLEQASFTTDQLAARNFRQLLRCGNCFLETAWGRVAGQPVLAGYVLVLFRKHTTVARIYSIAVDARFRGLGVGDQLLRSAEKSAAGKHCRRIQLEVRPENVAAIGMYVKHGYVQFGVLGQFYDDGTDALRLGKAIGASGSRPGARSAGG